MAVLGSLKTLWKEINNCRPHVSTGTMMAHSTLNSWESQCQADGAEVGHRKMVRWVWLQHTWLLTVFLVDVVRTFLNWVACKWKTVPRLFLFRVIVNGSTGFSNIWTKPMVLLTWFPEPSTHMHFYARKNIFAKKRLQYLNITKLSLKLTFFPK